MSFPGRTFIIVWCSEISYFSKASGSTTSCFSWAQVEICVSKIKVSNSFFILVKFRHSTDSNQVLFLRLNASSCNRFLTFKSQSSRMKNPCRLKKCALNKFNLYFSFFSHKTPETRPEINPANELFHEIKLLWSKKPLKTI